MVGGRSFGRCSSFVLFFFLFLFFFFVLVLVRPEAEVEESQPSGNALFFCFFLVFFFFFLRLLPLVVHLPTSNNSPPPPPPQPFISLFLLPFSFFLSFFFGSSLILFSSVDVGLRVLQLFRRRERPLGRIPGTGTCRDGGCCYRVFFLLLSFFYFRLFSFSFSFFFYRVSARSFYLVWLAWLALLMMEISLFFSLFLRPDS